MGIVAQTPPARTRESKYGYTEEDGITAADLLADDQNPGDGPFDTAGKARAAANALIGVLPEDAPEDVGSRVWETDDGFHYSLKIGKRAFHGRKAGKGKSKK